MNRTQRESLEATGSLFATAFKYFSGRQAMEYVRFDNPIQLESGRKFGPITVAYETYGTLAPSRDNVILIPHALTGDSHCASHGAHDSEEGWWEPLVGPGRVFDTDRFFIICANVLGGCQGTTGPASIDETTGEPYGMRFPVVTIRDMVRVQRMLLDHLGIERLFLVAGGSMGGMQTLQWAVDYPDMVGAALPIATPGRASAQAIAYNEVGRQAIMLDPYWRGGDYYGYADGPEAGLGVARMVGMITYQSDESMAHKFGRRLMEGPEADMYDLSTQFEVESYLHYQGRKLARRFDANTYIYLTRALDLFDLAHGYGSFEAALERIQCPVLLYGMSSDILYPTYQQKELADTLARLGKTIEYAELDTAYGHDGFLIEFPRMEPILREFVQDAYRFV